MNASSCSLSLQYSLRSPITGIPERRSLFAAVFFLSELGRNAVDFDENDGVFGTRPDQLGAVELLLFVADAADLCAELLVDLDEAFSRIRLAPGLDLLRFRILQATVVENHPNAYFCYLAL